jgi:glucokinase
MSSAPPSAPVSLGPGSPVLAVDVGGTTVKGALVDGTGALRAVRRLPAPPAGAGSGDAVVARVAQLLADCTAAAPGSAPAAVGLVVPGDVDERRGTGVYSALLGWTDVPFVERVRALTGLPVALGHDVRAAGLAELRVGAAAPFRDVVVLAIGTGIGAAVVVDGVVRTGTGMAGQLGHVRVADGPACPCGGQGCLGAVASASAIAAGYRAATGEVVRGAQEVLQRAGAGDAAARAVWESALDALALGLSQVTSLLAPEAFVVGGGLSQAGDALLVPLRDRLDAALTFQARPLVLRAATGQDAGLVGAALLARGVAATG